MSAWSTFKRGWMRFVDRFMVVQTFILLSIIYHLGIGPVALLARILRKPLLPMKSFGDREATSLATPIPRITASLDEAEKQF